MAILARLRMVYGQDERSKDPGTRWRIHASRRRILLATLIIGQTVIATDYMARVLPYHGRQPLEIAILVLFAVLFAWISADSGLRSQASSC